MRGAQGSSGVNTQKFVLGPNGKFQSTSTADDRCVSVPACAPAAAAASTEGYGIGTTPRVMVGGRGGAGLVVSKCNATSLSQQWIFSGPTPTFGGTPIISAASGGAQHCWEIPGCSSASPTTVDTDYACKPLPKPGWRNTSSPCVANMAWTVNSNQTITSVMDGSCIQLSSSDESSIEVAKCDGSKRQMWHIEEKKTGAVIIISELGGCVDNDAPAAYNPQYGGLVLADCEASGCGGQDHEWVHNPATKQLVSKVPGASPENKVCAEIGGYANHYSLLTSADCAPASAVPKNQQFEVDAVHSRVSVDVRFDATQQRSPGQLLCFDIDMGATPSGKVGPGSKLLSQVWAKKQPGGAVAVLIINADNSTARDISVTMDSLGLGAKHVHARNLWEQTDVAGVVGPTFVAKALPPQDSMFLLFK